VSLPSSEKKNPRVNKTVSSWQTTYLILSTAPDLGDYSASNRNEYQKHKKMFLGSRARPVREADNLTAISEPNV
jgi:hypothetical protein